MFQYFTTRTENALLLRRKRLGPSSNLQVGPVSPARGGRRKKSDGLRSTSSLRILKARMRRLRSSEKMGEAFPHMTRAGDLLLTVLQGVG